MKNFEITKENWSVSKRGGAVVTDSDKGFISQTGHLDSDYYGGTLICESLWRRKDAHLISAAPDMLEVLLSLENDDNTIPKSIWDLRNKAISKALGE